MENFIRCDEHLQELGDSIKATATLGSEMLERWRTELEEWTTKVLDIKNHKELISPFVPAKSIGKLSRSSTSRRCSCLGLGITQKQALAELTVTAMVDALNDQGLTSAINLAMGIELRRYVRFTESRPILTASIHQR